MIFIKIFAIIYTKKTGIDVMTCKSYKIRLTTALMSTKNAETNIWQHRVEGSKPDGSLPVPELRGLHNLKILPDRTHSG